VLTNLKGFTALILCIYNCNFVTTSAQAVDTQAAQNYELLEDGQELRSKHVAAIIIQYKPATIK
jgi:hypothetical protein